MNYNNDTLNLTYKKINLYKIIITLLKIQLQKLSNF